MDLPSENLPRRKGGIKEKGKLIEKFWRASSKIKERAE